MKNSDGGPLEGLLPPKVFNEDDARDSFLLFMWDRTTRMPDSDDDSPEGMNYLMDYVHIWLRTTNAVEMTAGSYETFLFVVQRIIDTWVNNRRIFDRKGTAPGEPYKRELKGIFHPERNKNLAPSKYEYEWKKFQCLMNDD